MNLIDELEREKAHSDGMKAAAEMWMRKAQDAQRTIANLVLAAGGRIDVYLHQLQDIDEIDMVMEEDLANFAITFRARRKNPSNKSSNN